MHRWVGRVYLFGGAFPTSVAVLTIAPFGTFNPNERIVTTVLAILWLAASVAGYRAGRLRRFAQHREWMIRSVALAFAIVADRVWMPLSLAVFAPEVFTDGDVNPAVIASATGAAHWLSIVVNLLVAEWWLRRTRSRDVQPAVASTPERVPDLQKRAR